MRNLKSCMVVAALLVAGGARADGLLMARTSSGGSGWSLIAHTLAAAHSSPITTSAINTTGADLVVLSMVNDTNSAPDCTTNQPTITDSKSNSWTLIISQYEQAPGGACTYLFYSHNPTVGSGHTFTGTTATAPVGTIAVQAWSGSASGTVTDQSNSGFTAGSTTSVGPNVITPSQNNSLVVTAFGGQDGDVSDPKSINGSYVISDQNNFVSGTNYAGALAYFVQSTAAATNPTWSWTNNAQAAAVIADFK